MGIRVFREEIYDATASGFERPPVSRDELMQSARRNEARDEVIDLLSLLPNRQFSHLRELWDYLDVPVTRELPDEAPTGGAAPAPGPVRH